MHTERELAASNASSIAGGQGFLSSVSLFTVLEVFLSSGWFIEDACERHRRHGGRGARDAGTAQTQNDEAKNCDMMHVP
jgi:hypothetical protein